MSDPVKPPPSKGGDQAKMWGGVILFLVIVFSGVFSALTNQLGGFFMMMKMNAGPIMAILAVVFIIKATK